MLAKNKYLSVIILIAVNLFPIFGVIFLGWDIFEIVILYIVETFIIGILNAFKMRFANGRSKIAMIIAFLFQYNLFIAIEIIFVFILLGKEESSFLDVYNNWDNLVAILSDPNILFTVVTLAISHFFSFYYNFYKKRLFDKHPLKYYFTAPYKRIYIQHLVVIFGGWIGIVFNTPIGYLLLLVVLKTVFDMKTHMKMNAIRK